jgi:mono/diheme cytochrome c family protein
VKPPPSLKFISLVLAACVGLTAEAFEQGTHEPLAWDALTKQQTLPPGETTAHFAFSVTNVSAGEVVVEKVSASCGCTAVQLPATPWRLAPGNHGDLKFIMDLRGKRGTVTKTATVQTSAGIKVLTLSAIMPEGRATRVPDSILNVSPLTSNQTSADSPRLLQAAHTPGHPSPAVPAPSPLARQGEKAMKPAAAFSSPSPFVGRGERDGVRGERPAGQVAQVPVLVSANGTRIARPSETRHAEMQDNRTRNQALALADHQAVFRGDCARCHAEPAKGKLGKELYVAVCGICHDAEHRADMVPVLGKSDQAHNPAYWRTWITFGKPGSLMPAFAQSLGGPLDREQIESLAAYLVGGPSPRTR